MLNLFDQLKKAQVCLLCFLVPGLLFAAGIVGAALLCRVSVLLAGAFSAAVLCALYIYRQRVALPLLRTWRLYARLLAEAPETVSGTVLGWKAGKTTQQGVMMRALVLDTGETVRGEKVPREVNVPALLLPTVQTGAVVQILTRENIALSLSPCEACRVEAREGRYAVSALVLGGLALLCAVGWASGYALYQRAHQKPTVAVAVCTPAHRPEAEAALQDAFAAQGLPTPIFSYTNTLDPETVYSFLATYGALEADCLLLSEGTFRAVFDGDVPALPIASFSEGDDLRFLTNAEDEPVAVILYDPRDEGYSARFRALIDWVAVPREDRYILALAPQGEGRAEDAVRGLVHWLLARSASKE
jgi:hypothetical protein